MDKSYKYLTVTLWFIVLIQNIVFFYCTDKSIDFCDDSFNYFLLTKSEVGYPLILYGFLSEPVISFFGLGYNKLVITGHLILISIFTFLGISVRKFIKIKYNKTNTSFVLPFILSIAYSNYNFQTKIAGYNTLILILAVFLISILISIVITKKKSLLYYTYIFTLFVTLICITLIKAYMSFILLIIIFFVFHYSNQSKRDYFIIFSSMVILFLFCNFQSESINFIYDQIEAYQDLNKSSHNISSIITSDFLSIYLIQIQGVLKSFDVLIALLIMCRYSHSKKLYQNYIIIALILYVYLRFYLRSYLFGGSNAAYFSSIPYLVIIISFQSYLLMVEKNKAIINLKGITIKFAIILFIVPFVLSLGSRAPITSLVTTYLFAWALLLLVLGIHLQRKEILCYLIFIFSSTVTFQSTNALTYNYSYATFLKQPPIYNCNHKLHINDEFGSIYVNKSQLDFISEIQKLYLELDSLKELKFIDISGRPGLHLFFTDRSDFHYGKYLSYNQVPYILKMFENFILNDEKELIIHTHSNDISHLPGAVISIKKIISSNTFLVKFKL